MKKIVFISLIACLLAACSTHNQIAKSKDNVKQIELGMTKKEVITIMGKKYEVFGASQTLEGAVVEVLQYEGADSKLAYASYGADRYYLFTFEDGRLVEWHTEKINPMILHSKRNGNNHDHPH